jgi:UDP-N-acetylmuramoylalanine--D-glutamate ligase
MNQNPYIKTGSIIAVVGFGKTGKGVLDFLLSRHDVKDLDIYLYNDTPIENPAEQEQYKQRGVTFLVGEDQFKWLHHVQRIVLSPGVDGRTPRFHQLRRGGVEIISEIELAASFLDPQRQPIIAVTGTNGKSTTVSLIHHILTHCGIDSVLAGNIGTPFISCLDDISGKSNVAAVLEVSSFQLEEVKHFRPYIGILLNVTPDHLDRYAATGDYFAAKLNLVRNQESSDYLVLNFDDPLLRENAAEDHNRCGFAKKLWFSRSSRSPGKSGGSEDSEVNAWIPGKKLYLRLAGDGPEKISLRSNPLRGVHNLENIMAAVLAARVMGAKPKDIETAIPLFHGLPHRMESLGKIGSVEFINDSKATNVDAALKSITSIREPMVVILGGKDKGGDFTILEPAINERVTGVLLVGYAADIIRGQLDSPPIRQKMTNAANFDEAVDKGLRILGKKGGVVLLAPACASFDMFDNFEHRGQVFKEAFLRLKRKREQAKKKEV